MRETFTMEEQDASGDPDPPPLRTAARVEIVDRTGAMGARRGAAGSHPIGAPMGDGPALTPEAIDFMARMGEQALAELAASGELRVAIVGDDQMALAHERDTGVVGTTDVLTYDLSEGQSALTRTLDADVLVCLDEARRQSARRGIPVERELLLYVLHAALHCLGFDDMDDASSEAMHAEEDRVLEAIGVGATFAAGAAADGGTP